MPKKIFISLLILFTVCSINWSFVSECYPFDFITSHFSQARHTHLPKKYKHLKLNRAEANAIRKGKYKEIAGRDVYYNDSNFSNTTKDAFGVDNCARMLAGKAPIGHDGIEVSLHHLHQMNDGIIVELETSYHRKHNKDLHKYKEKSEINRNEFNLWKKEYWRERGKMRCK